MNATMDLSSLLAAPTWDAGTVDAIRRAAFESAKNLEQFKSWVRQTAGQSDRAANLKAGIGLLLLGQAKEAQEQLKQASEGDLKRYYLGIALRETGQHEASLADFERVEGKGLPSLAVAMQQVETLRLAGRLDQADKLLAKHAKTGEDVAEYQYQRGCVSARQGRGEEAVTCLRRALDLDPQHAGACFQLAFILSGEGDVQEAIELYRRCVQTPPAPVSALINLATLYEDQGDYELALCCLQEVLRSDPNHARARLYRKDTLAGMTQYYDEVQERIRDKRTQVLEIPITDFELSVRSRNCLKKMNIHTLGDLLRVTEEELLSYKNFGETSLNEIKAVLAQKGLRLGQALEENLADPRRSAAMALVASEPDDVLSKPVDDLDLSIRSRRCLERLGLRTLGDLAARSEAELMAAKNFGATSLSEIKEQLSQYGLSLRRLEE